jgi:hypothetical protein
MQTAMRGCAGLFLGAIVGAPIGVGLGFLWTTIFKTSDFEGYSGMLVFFTFMPLGAIVGAIAGAVLLARTGAK